MCDTCGCPGSPNEVTISKPGDHHHDHHHPHGHQHPHPHDHHHPHVHDDEGQRGRTIRVEQEVLGKNDAVARGNREFFAAHGIVAFNLVSSPGSGKTTILEKTLAARTGSPMAVIEGDQQTTNDADRIAATGAPVVQVNTGAGCHLDADMVRRALPVLAPADNSILFIENVGNLVCPAMFDLGEAAKVVIISVTEGDDKPLKYPAMFRAASLCLINKIDLLPHVNFDLDRCREFARRVNHDLQFFELSAVTGQGMDDWLAWLGRMEDRSSGND
jgi:hydrogenase nickel incorporation protein HypB